MANTNPVLLDRKVKSAIRKISERFLRKVLHLIPFFAGFVLSRFYQLSFHNDIFLIGILVTAVLLFTVRDGMPEPPYKD